MTTHSYRTLHLINTKYYLLGLVHGTFPKIKNLVGHRKSHNDFKSINLQATFSDNNAIELETTSKKIMKNNFTICKSRNAHLILGLNGKLNCDPYWKQ